MFALNLLKNQVSRQIWRPNCRQIITKAKFKDGGEYPTFNDLPVPEGCWQEDNTRKQNHYMMVLASGFVALVGSCFYVVNSGKIMFNWTIPDYPYDDDDDKKN